MAKSWEKSFAVESLHRISSKFKLETVTMGTTPDVSSFEELLDIGYIWRNPEPFEGLGLNDALKRLRGMRDGSVTLSDITGFVHTRNGYRSV